MSTSAHERRCYLANNSARDIANSLFQKWAVKGFFRRVSEANRGRGQPRRGYRRPKPTAHSDVGRLRSRRAAGFLLHTFLSPPKEKCERPIGLQALLPRRSRRTNPHPGQGYAPAGAPKGFPRGKQSARFALPCAPLVVCLNSGSLTAFGGCIHWIPASLRSPLESFGHRSWRETMGQQALALTEEFSFCEANRGLSSMHPIPAARTAVQPSSPLPPSPKTKKML